MNQSTGNTLSEAERKIEKERGEREIETGKGEKKRETTRDRRRKLNKQRDSGR